MKTWTAAAFLTTLLTVLIIAPQQLRVWLALLATAAILLASTGLTPAYYRKTGWPTTRYTFVTLGVQTATAFFSTVVNVAFNPQPYIIIPLLAANIYLLTRLVAEAVAIASTDAGVTTAALILGFSSFTTYLVTLAETGLP